MKSEILLSTAYFPPVQYFCCLASASRASIEAHEHYEKQTYRSRCNILAANGVLTLSVPVLKTHGDKMPIRDVRIDYALAWPRQHWRSLVAAYSSSPFFLYYADDIQALLQRREAFLFDLNMRITQTLCDIIGLQVDIAQTEAYQAMSEDIPLDFRYAITPKKNRQQPFAAATYYQTFGQKFGFVPNLSVLDLLFNEGSEALSVLRCSKVHPAL